MKNIRAELGTGPSVHDLVMEMRERIGRIEKLLETINLRLAASPWRPGGSGEI